MSLRPVDETSDCAGLLQGLKPAVSALWISLNAAHGCSNAAPRSKQWSSGLAGLVV